MTPEAMKKFLGQQGLPQVSIAVSDWGSWMIHMKQLPTKLSLQFVKTLLLMELLGMFPRVQ